MATYTIIGHDQKQYALVTEAQLRQWIAEGRVNAQTRIQAEGTPEWKSFLELPEFADLAEKAAAPPPLSSAAPVAAPARTSAMAVTSLVMGIVGIITCGITLLLTAPVGLVLGAIALNKIGKSQGRLGGKGLALTGVILNGVTLLLIPVFAAMMLPALAAAKQKAQAINCVNNEKELWLAIKIYSGDNTNCFPAAATWCDAIKDEAGSEKIYKCPATDSSSRCGYAFNTKLGGMDMDKVDPQTVVLFESDTGWNANGGQELMINQSRHARVFVVALADGTVTQVRESQLNTLRWDP